MPTKWNTRWLMPAVMLLLAAASQSPQSGAAAIVNIDNFAFTPAVLTVPVGTVVTWNNRDDIPHTVTSADTPRAFKSEPLDTGDHFTAHFDHPGRFAYFCSLHAHMQGMVVVR